MRKAFAIIFAFLRITLAIVFAYFIGYFGLAAAFSDLGPSETVLNRLVVTGLVFLFGGFIVGIIEKRIWYLAGICAWGPIRVYLGIGFLGLGMVKWEAISVYMILPIALSLLGGYIGFRIRNRLSEIRSRRV